MRGEKKTERMDEKKKWLLTAFMCMWCLCLMAQGDSLWTVSGRVVDAKTRKAMASVSVMAGRVGTVTNADGEFVLKVSGKPREVVFSCLGYLSRRLTAAECKNLEQQEQPVRMQASSVMLDEVIVEGREARDIVLRAISKIEQNYPKKADLLRGFYRETVQKRQRFVSIAEGVVDVYKTGYQRGENRDGVAILKGRRLLSQRSSDTLAVKLQGGPVLPIILDIVKERDILLNADELEKYTLRLKSPEKMDGRLQYVVELTPRKMDFYALWTGRLYIDHETLAFTKIDLSLDMSDEEKVTSMILRKKPFGLRFSPKQLSVAIDYTTDNGVTRMNYIRNEIRFRCDWKRKVFKSNFIVVSELVVTDRNEGDNVKPIKVRDTFFRQDNFYDKVIYFNDPDFWGTENIIEPTEDLLKGIEKIKKLRKREKHGPDTEDNP